MRNRVSPTLRPLRSSQITSLSTMNACCYRGHRPVLARPTDGKYQSEFSLVLYVEVSNHYVTLPGDGRSGGSGPSRPQRTHIRIAYPQVQEQLPGISQGGAGYAISTMLHSHAMLHLAAEQMQPGSNRMHDGRPQAAANQNDLGAAGGSWSSMLTVRA